MNCESNSSLSAPVKGEVTDETVEAANVKLEEITLVDDDFETDNPQFVNLCDISETPIKLECIVVVDDPDPEAPVKIKQECAESDVTYIKAFFECKLCKKPFKSHEKFSLHESFHAKLKPYKCSACDTYFKLTSDRQEHMKTHSASFECPECHKVFKYATALLSHKQNVHEGRQKGLARKTCQVCGKSCKSADKLLEHLRIHTGEKPFGCEVCGKCFRMQKQLRRHILLHLNGVHYACSTCNEGFSNENSLNEHRKQAHRTRVGRFVNFKPYRCDICYKRFRTARLLNGHEKTHYAMTSYQCNRCERVFTEWTSLSQHVAFHNSRRLFQCGICKVRFPRLGDLRMHEGYVHGNGGRERDQGTRAMEEESVDENVKQENVVEVGCGVVKKEKFDCTAVHVIKEEFVASDVKVECKMECNE